MQKVSELTQKPSQSDLSLTPGAYVRHPDRPDWGLGQVQSVDGNRVTVNFEHAGKILIRIDVITLSPARIDDR